MTFSSEYWLSEEMYKDCRQSTTELDTQAKEGSRWKSIGVHITMKVTNLNRYTKLRAYVINNISSSTAPGQNDG
jgi:hypothetical protein